ncbi:uncharacterized protein [Triticum aestivum]|uniref:uncharacterized protein isoform X3 n=1 Tax=Triticum aestivum TaxID=4565 RepID=UPI001D022588|nr:uncharacterized protein LOC123104407 isoform X3 [Triticum aestivum]
MWSGTRAVDREQRRSSGAADLEQSLRPHGAHVVVFVRRPHLADAFDPRMLCSLGKVKLQEKSTHQFQGDELVWEVEAELSEFSVCEFHQILEATSNFSEENKIGEGGFGPVYKDDRRVHVIERDLTEPDRIVGELLQPGGYLKLIELGLQENLVEKGWHADVYNGQLADGQFVAVKRMLRGRPRRAGAAGGGTSNWSRRSSPSSAGAALATPMPGPSTSGKEAIIHPVSEIINTHTMSTEQVSQLQSCCLVTMRSWVQVLETASYRNVGKGCVL